jgi:hypothetical protein
MDLSHRSVVRLLVGTLLSISFTASQVIVPLNVPVLLNKLNKVYVNIEYTYMYTQIVNDTVRVVNESNVDPEIWILKNATPDMTRFGIYSPKSKVIWTAQDQR